MKADYSFPNIIEEVENEESETDESPMPTKVPYPSKIMDGGSNTKLGTSTLQSSNSKLKTSKLTMFKEDLLNGPVRKMSRRQSKILGGHGFNEGAKDRGTSKDSDSFSGSESDRRCHSDGILYEPQVR